MTEQFNDIEDERPLSEQNSEQEEALKLELETLSKKYGIPSNIDMMNQINLLRWVYDSSRRSKNRRTASQQKAHSEKVAATIRNLRNKLADTAFSDRYFIRRRFEEFQILASIKILDEDQKIQKIHMIEFDDFLECLSLAGMALEDRNVQRWEFIQNLKKENPELVNKGPHDRGLWQVMPNLERFWLSLPADGKQREFKKYVLYDEEPANPATQFVVDMMRLIAPEVKPSSVISCMKSYTQTP